jgi:hypothetical protein
VVIGRPKEHPQPGRDQGDNREARCCQSEQSPTERRTDVQGVHVLAGRWRAVIDELDAAPIHD